MRKRGSPRLFLSRDIIDGRSSCKNKLALRYTVVHITVKRLAMVQPTRQVKLVAYACYAIAPMPAKIAWRRFFRKQCHRKNILRRFGTTNETKSRLSRSCRDRGNRLKKGRRQEIP